MIDENHSSLAEKTHFRHKALNNHNNFKQKSSKILFNNQFKFQSSMKISTIKTFCLIFFLVNGISSINCQTSTSKSINTLDL